MKKAVRWVSSVILSGASWGACASDEGDSSDGHTSWLGACVADDDCESPLVCDCGICTRICDETTECAELFSSSACLRVERDATGVCSARADASSGICAPTCGANADCSSIAGHLECSAGVCSPVAPAVEDASRADSSEGGTGGAGAVGGRGGTGAVGGMSGAGGRDGGPPPPDALFECTLTHGFDAAVIDHFGIEGTWQSVDGTVHEIASVGVESLGRGLWTITRDGMTDRYHVLELGGDFLTAFNDVLNGTDICQYSRFDWMYEVAEPDAGPEGGPPPFYEPVLYVCEATHSALTDAEAWYEERPDRANLEAGCNGGPWTRLTRIGFAPCAPFLSASDLSEGDAFSLCRHQGWYCTICPQGDAGTVFSVFNLACACDSAAP